MIRPGARVAVVLVAALACVPGRAAAQQSDEWRFSVVPLYFWAASIDGTMAAGPADVPITLDFDDAADHLAGAFSLHVEATKGRWGAFGDVNFISLASAAEFGAGAISVTGDLELDNVVFEAGGLYFIHPARQFGVIAGVRTYTLAPTIGIGESTAVDASETSVNFIGGVVFRPPLSAKWTFIGRADVGFGEADLTWSAVAGLGYRLVSWSSLEFGFKGLGIDQDGGDRDLRQYDVTHYGPIVGLRFHW
jgi:hypothetical protein